MKAIFLDIDGVLNSTGFQKNNGTRLIDRENAALLKKLIDKTGTAVVLSSGWKLWFDPDMKPVTEEAVYLHNLLCEYGITIYDKTPDHSTEEIRKDRTFTKVKAKEIKAWLGAHKDTESYIVLDDLDLNDGDLRSRTIHVNNTIGLSEEDIRRAAYMLNPKN